MEVFCGVYFAFLLEIGGGPGKLKQEGLDSVLFMIRVILGRGCRLNAYVYDVQLVFCKNLSWCLLVCYPP